MSEDRESYITGEAPDIDVYLRHIGDDRYVVETRDERITTLEQALLKAWWDSEYGVCEVCGSMDQRLSKEECSHTPDCIIPDLLEKYQDSPDTTGRDRAR